MAFRNIIFILFIFSSSIQFAWSKSTLIRLGYSSCIACHVSPAGGSQLTKYGRGFSDTESLIAYESADTEEDKLNRFSMLHGFQARVIDLKNAKKSEIFLMQADYLNSTSINSKNRIDTAVGLTPARVRERINAGSGILGKNFILRKLTYNIHDDNNEISFGRDFPISGLVIEDHTSYIRSASRNGVTDYVTRFRFDNWNEQRQFSVSIDAPSFEEFNQNREWATHVRFEKYLTNSFALGISPFFGETKNVRRYGTSLFSRLALGEKAGVLSEAQWTRRVSKQYFYKPFMQSVYMVRPFYNLFNWLEVQGVFEILSREEPFLNKSLQYGLGTFARIWRGFNVQLEIRQSRKFSEPVPATIWILQGSVFI